jgi:phosphate uptake regulator
MQLRWTAEAASDLEQIADYAYEISDLGCQTDRRANSQLISQIVTVGENVRAMLANALDGWRNLEQASGLSPRTTEAGIRNDSRALAEKLYPLTSAPADAQIYVNLILICKHFERMARLSASVAEQAALAAPAERSASQ